MPNKTLTLDVVDQVIEEFSTEFLDTNTYVPNEQGGLSEAGSVLRLGPNLIFLEGLSELQLKELKTIVGVAVDYELKKRSQP